MGQEVGPDSKLLDRAFNKAFSVHNDAEQQAQPRVKTPKDKDAELRELTTSMDVTDAVSRMLLAQRDGDYFRCTAEGKLPAVLSGLHLCIVRSTKQSSTRPGVQRERNSQHFSDRQLLEAAAHLAWPVAMVLC